MRSDWHFFLFILFTLLIFLILLGVSFGIEPGG